MNTSLHTIKTFFQNESVFCIATLAALISAFIVTPDVAYLSYIDFRVLALLLSLMLVVAGLTEVGLFDKLMPVLCKRMKTERGLSMVLVLACFFISMWVTNDVALITFVPFSILILEKTGLKKLLIPVIVMQTVAANLGSMCTPIGNPQNLYLYTTSGMNISGFIQVMFPYTLCSFILIMLTMLLFKPLPLSETISLEANQNEGKVPVYKTILFLVLMVLCLMSVLHLVDYRICLVVVLIISLILSPALMKKPDYMLLLTFVSFFVFVGNMKRIPAIDNFLAICVKNHEVLCSVLASQCISNVPAAILLSGFTKNYAGLMIGTNLGGLGTLIASMASLISYKYYAKIPGCDKKKYLLIFTLVNVIYLVILVFLYYLIH